MKQTFFRNHENRSNRILPQEKKIQAGIKKDRTGSARARLVFFGLLTGNGTTVVIREGTLIQALLTGLCMKLTDPIVDRIFGNFSQK